MGGAKYIRDLTFSCLTTMQGANIYELRFDGREVYAMGYAVRFPLAFSFHLN